MQVYFNCDGTWFEGQLYADFVYGFLNKENEVMTISAIKIQDDKGYRETIFRSETAYLFPGERLVVTPKQALDLKMGIYGVDYKHKYHPIDKAF
jgi:hypothetical protein